MGCWEEICLKILFWLFLILSDYVENCLNLCPSPARRETVFGRLRAAAYDHLHLARNRLYRYHFDGNYSIFPYGLIEFLEYFFFEVNGCRNNIFIILRYVDGGIPLRHPSWGNHIQVGPPATCAKRCLIFSFVLSTFDCQAFRDVLQDVLLRNVETPPCLMQ